MSEVDVKEKFLKRSFKDFPVFDYDFFDIIAFDLSKDNGGYSLHFVFTGFDEKDENYGFILRTGIYKKTIQEIADWLVNNLQLWGHLTVDFEGSIIDFEDDSKPIETIDWMEDYFKNCKDIKSIVELDNNGFEMNNNDKS